MIYRCSAEAPGRAFTGILQDMGDGGRQPAAREAGSHCLLNGDPGGRRIVLVHARSGEARAWNRLLRSVPFGQEWVAVARPDPRPCEASFHGRNGPSQASDAVAALRPLLIERRGRKPVLIGCGTGVSVALRAALDHPDLIGGLLLIDPAVAEPPRPGVLRRITARLRAPVPGGIGGELLALAPQLGTIRMPVMLVQGKDEPPGLGTPFIEQALTGCRTLMVVTVPGDRVPPAKHEPAVRGALAALVAAVERGGA